MIKILVVDDESGIRSLLTEILTDEGYMVYEAEDADAARKIMSRDRFNLILLDIWMPDTDGITLLREWVARGAIDRSYVVMMSGHGSIESAAEAVRLGAKGFLEKPISMKVLLETVHHLIDEWEETHVMPIDHQAQPGDAPKLKNQPAEQPVDAFGDDGDTADDNLVPLDSDDYERYTTFTHGTLRTLDTIRERLLSPCCDLKRALATFRSLDEHSESDIESAQVYANSVLTGLLTDVALRRLNDRGIDWLLGSAPRSVRSHYFAKLNWIINETFAHRSNYSITKADMMARRSLHPLVNGEMNPEGYEEATVRTTHILGSGLSQYLPREMCEYAANYLPEAEPIGKPSIDVDKSVEEALKADVEKPDEHFEPCTTYGLQNFKRPQKLFFPPLTYGNIESDIRTSLALCTLPTLPVIYVKAYNLLIDYNQPLKDCREAIERSYMLTHLFAEDFSVATVARISMIERTHLYRKLKASGVQPSEINRIWRFIKSGQPDGKNEAEEFNFEEEFNDFSDLSDISDDYL